MKTELIKQLALRVSVRAMVVLLLLSTVLGCGRSDLNITLPEGGVLVDVPAVRDVQTGDSSDMLVALVITPPAAATIVNGVAMFTAFARYSSGRAVNVTAMSTWSIANPMIATLRGAGSFVGARPGTAQVTATYMGFTATADLTVSDAQLMSIVVTPNRAMVPPGTTQSFIANGRFSNGQMLDRKSVV